MNTFIQIYVLISLWFWAGILLSKPLRSAFGDMHRRILKRLFDATVEKFVKIFEPVKLFVKRRIQQLRIEFARVLIGEILQPNVVSAIAKARNMDSWNSGVTADELLNMFQLAGGEPLSHDTHASAVKAAFKVCDTVLFEEIIAKVPCAQERILLAFDQLEGRAPYDSIKNEAYRKFIRE